MAAEPPSGVNFFLPWSALEWVITSLFTVAAAIAVWVWNLGRRIDAADARMDKIDSRIKGVEDAAVQLEKDNVATEAELEKVKTAIVVLRTDILEKIHDLPSRVFIESQIQQMTGRIDGIVDAKIVSRLPPREA